PPATLSTLSLHDALPIYSRTTRRDCTIPDLPMPCSVRSARTDSAAAGSESWSGIPGEILLAWNARISSGTPATSRAVQGQRVMRSEEHTSELQSLRYLVC